MLTASCSTNFPAAPNNPTITINTVFLKDIANAERPAIDTPESRTILKPTTFNSNQAEFDLIITTATPNELRIVINNQPPVPVSQSSETENDAAPSFHIESRSPTNHRLTIRIPTEMLTDQFLTLEIAATVINGTPVGGFQLQIVPEFFYLAAIGDSVMWGNGLAEQDKFTTLVANLIEDRLHKKVIFQRYAQSGAKIVPAPEDGVCEYDCFGEVPLVNTSINRQAELVQAPELIDLVLMDGCINDVDVNVIINPRTTDQEILDRTDQFCHDEVSDLLRRVHTRMPNAAIVVTGYFPIVGPDSDFFGLQQWLASRALPQTTQTEDPIVSALEQNSIAFLHTAHVSIISAVRTINTEITNFGTNGKPPIAFADPNIHIENAAFSPDRWLWSMSSELPNILDGITIDLDLFPEDATIQRRAQLCLDPDASLSLIECLYASVAHPNPAGARAYAAAIESQLVNMGIIPAN